MLMSLNINELNVIGKVGYFKKLTEEYISMDGIFSDETENFITPAEPTYLDNIKIKIRTSKNNVDKVYIHYENEKYEMNFFNDNNIFSFFNLEIDPINKPLNYYFSLVKNNRVYYYNKKGVSKNIDHAYNFNIIPDFKTPEWSKGSVMYQIYIDRFFNGDKTNDVIDKEYIYLGRLSKQMKNWSDPVEADDVANFYGGDLQGVIDKMFYLNELGIDAIYFNPIFVSPSNHKYDVQDYDYVDPHFGVIINDDFAPLDDDKPLNRHANMYIQRTTNKENLEESNKLFIKLVEIAHSYNIKVILDGVFNHSGAFNKWLDKENFYFKAGYPAGAYRSEESIYHNYFSWYEKAWPNNDLYDSWWGYENHPKLNLEGSKELYNYILEIGAKWVSPPFNADGWRLDVAADLGHTEEFNHKFWTDFRNSVKKANPEAIIFAEHYGDPKSWLQGNQWDTVMNYDAFMEPITWFLTGMEKHSEDYKENMLNNAMAFEDAMRYHMSRFSYQSLHCSMNQLSNHDHSRFMTRTNKTVGRLHTDGGYAADKNINISVMLEAITFQMTWPGAATLYYGDEAGMTGWTDPDNRRTFPWGNENKMLTDFYKIAIKSRKESVALTKGSMNFIYSSYGILSYGRWYEDESIIVLINNNDKGRVLTLPVWKANVVDDKILYQVFSTTNDIFYNNKQEFYVKDGQLIINAPAHSSIVLSNKN